jgi:hypothetical protein
MTSAARIASAVAFLLIGFPSFAEMKGLTYTEFAKGRWRQFADVVKARELSPRDGDLAQKIAAEWVYVGPCEGDSRKLQNGSDGFDAISFVLQMSPSSPLGAAVSQMITIMMSDNLGRKPVGHTCRFALETVAPYEQSGPVPKKSN